MPKPIHRREHALVCHLLVELRHGAGLKQEEVAESLNRPQPYISSIETGQRRVDIVELRDLCFVLGTTLPEFVARLEQMLLKPEKSVVRVRRRVD